MKKGRFMSDINKLFDRFPDYDVFSGKTKPPEKPRQNARRAPEAPVKRAPKKQPHPEPVRDYGDGFGKAVKPVKVKSQSKGAFFSALYFPILIIWLEITLRFFCGEELNPESLLYNAGFSLPIGFALTVICTFGSKVFNRVLSIFFTLAITLFYIFEAAYFSVFHGFFSFQNNSSFTFEQLFGALNGKILFVIVFALPMMINLIIGHKIFPFYRLKITAKLAVIAVAVLIQLIAISAVNFSEDISAPVTSYKIYRSESPDISVQERFGLLTMERLSAFSQNR